MAKTGTTDSAETMGKRRGRPPKSASADTAADNSASFWETCSNIPKEEWEGGRALIYLYRREPVINRSGNHYIEVYDEPINEDRILRDHGSGVYKLILNFRKPGEDSGKAIDGCVISILNSNYPPKIEPGEWIDDQKNRNWKWAKATFPKPPSEGGTLLEAVRVVGEIQAAAKQQPEKREDRPEPNRVLETVETIRAVKELMPAQPAPQTENKTLDSIVQMMSKQNDTLMQLLMTQLKDARDKQPTPTEKTSIKDVISLVKDEVLPLVEKLKPGEVIDGITRRSKMSGWQEMLQPAIPVVVDFLKPFAAGLATNLFARAGQPNPPTVMNGNATPAAQPYGAQSPALPQPPPQQNSAMPPLLNMIAPALLNYMRVDADPQELGEDFASWVHEGYQADPRFNSAIGMARAGGPQMIIAQFKGSPWWMDKGANHDQQSLAEMEGKFGMFVNAFLNWQPGAQVEDGSPEVIDIG